MRSCKIKSESCLSNTFKNGSTITELATFLKSYLQIYGIHIHTNIQKKYNIDMSTTKIVNYIKWRENTALIHDIYSHIYSIEYVLNNIPFDCSYSTATECLTIRISSGNKLFDFLEEKKDLLFNFNSITYTHTNDYILNLKTHLVDLNDLFIEI